MFDLKSKVSAEVALDAAALDADTEGTLIDMQGAHSALFLIEVGVGGIVFDADNKVEFVMTHGDESDESDAAEVDLADVEGPVSVSGGVVHSLTAEHAAATVTAIGYVGGKRYVKVTADFSGVHGAETPVAVTVIKGDLDLKPAV